MPAMRANATVGEWIAGITPARMGLRLAFIMNVTEALSRQKYWERYQLTRLDSIYEPQANGDWRQHKNPWHDKARYHYDVDANRVLLSSKFYNFSRGYDGHPSTVDPAGALVIPAEYRSLAGKCMRGSGHFKQVPYEFIAWVKSQHTVELDTLDEFILP
jgi:hypothetical protein